MYVKYFISKSATFYWSLLKSVFLFKQPSNLFCDIKENTLRFVKHCILKKEKITGKEWHRNLRNTRGRNLATFMPY